VTVFLLHYAHGMLFGPGMRRAALAALLTLAVGSGCGRWQPPKNYDVATQSDPQSAYAAVLEVAAAKEYTVVSRDDATKKVRLEARVSGKEADRKSFIDVEVAAGSVRLFGAGHLVRDGKVHKTLSNELKNLEHDLKERLAAGPAPAAAPVAAATAEPPVSAGVPVAWSEPAYDPSVWGNGNFTCLPVRVPAEHQAALSLQLSNGEKADLQLSLAYAPELCRSPSECKVAGGCPALGIGDPERVSRIAGRLSRGEIATQALLLDGGKPVANIDLARHGSIQQAMSEIKR
jgi:hypothetical protein